MGSLIYKLKLLEYIKILCVQYISVLEPADPDILVIEDTPDIDPKSQKKMWEVNKILDIGLIDNNQQKYLIK